MSITTFSIDQPDTANAFDLETALLLKRSVDSAIQKGEGGLIITAAKDKTFCSGGNLKAYGKLKSKNQGVLLNRKITKILADLKIASILVVAAIEGDVVGGGCELALACDFIIASQRSRFSFRQVNQGLTPGWGGATSLLKRVTPSVALDWLTSGRWIDSQEAFEKGLIDQIVPKNETRKHAAQFILEHKTPLIGIFKTLIDNQGAGEGKVFEKLWWSIEHRKAMNRALVPRPTDNSGLMRRDFCAASRREEEP